MQFLYVGRLDKEKWIESIIFCIIQLIEDNIDFHIDIYGTWLYTHDIKNLSYKYPNNVTYHGRKHKKDIIWQRTASDFFVMPSCFLETFGLTACESLLCWVPVIANKKWWLIPFVDDTLDIQQAPWTNDWEKLYHILSTLIQNNVPKTRYKSLILSTQQTYTQDKWIQTLHNIIPKQTKILMISDFINYNWGGIETHIHDSWQLLQKNNYQTDIYGHQAPTGKRATIKKIITMWSSLYNIRDSYKICHTIQNKKIWLIWRHSISRVIWRIPVRTTSHCITQIITHHELGLFHPFPSQTTQQDQIPDARSLSAFVKAGQTNNFFKKIIITGKYLMIRCIHKQLQKKIKTHIVPSERMIPMVRQRHPQAHIVCIPHFVSMS